MRRTQWRKKHLSVSIIVLILAAVMVIMVINSGTDDEEVLHSPLWHQRNLRDDKLMMETVWRAQGPLQADHPDLLRLLRERYLDRPSTGPPNLVVDRTGSEAHVYNLYRTNFPSWVRINNLLHTLFSDTPPGFFLEAGALDGEFISNTLYLEQQLGWTGLLVEADPVLYDALPGKKRRAWSSHTCLSPAPYPQKLTFESYRAYQTTSIIHQLLVRSTGNLAGVSSPAGGRMGVKVREMVQCFPLISYLLALNTTTVHYLSLDVEGAEADILITLPWEKLDVTVWSIEHRDTNTKFRELYQEATEDPLPKNLQEENTKEAHEENEKPSPHEVVKVRKKVVVYVNAHDPAGGKDDYFVRFMTERGYMLYYYWDGDYTFIKKNSSICQRHCPIL
ncbi:uncharacterized protein LOC121866686 [Homarus americanus]|uniref:uncharacterized protein LOC121866686 n=1 Tax=Homarus americanus TaxID=6706 RepID=UPI001C493EE3|nr:uncharacterized protein LOC121866686 [Homarus americanus]XP_042222333.1 uncharacterized protein LOC121866686 [Homarus americanus]XP_042222334.1 uncharacterized protein LOC121866686 [Homarus americanus]XP_042222335.1 uncharacterized protein LOC121866686 [Homarus americanus]